MSAAEFEKIKRIAEENGRLGEEFVLDYETKRLTERGRSDLAKKIKHVGDANVRAGYDVLSYEENESKRHIEVKSTSGTGLSFYVTRNEWATAKRLKGTYYIYLVTSVRSAPKVARMLQDPVALHEAGDLKLVPNGWWIRVTPTGHGA